MPNSKIGHRNYQEYAKGCDAGWDTKEHYCGECGYVRGKRCPNCDAPTKLIDAPEYDDPLDGGVPTVTVSMDGIGYSGYLHHAVTLDRLDSDDGEHTICPSELGLKDEMRAHLKEWEAQKADRTGYVGPATD